MPSGEEIDFTGKGITETERGLLVPEPPRKEKKKTRGGRARGAVKRVKKARALFKTIQSFTITEPFLNENGKWLAGVSPEERKKAEQFLQLYLEDHREDAKRGRPLTRPETEYARGLASRGIEKEKSGPNRGRVKKVFVATTRERAGGKTVAVPIGYMFYWVTPGGRYESDRIFIRDKYRGRGYAPRIAYRSFARAYLEHRSAQGSVPRTEITSAIYRDAHPLDYPTMKSVVEPMAERGLIDRHDLEGKDIHIYINRSELMREIAQVRAYDRLKGTSLWRVLRRPRLRKALIEHRKREIAKWRSSARKRHVGK